MVGARRAVLPRERPVPRVPHQRVGPHVRSPRVGRDGAAQVVEVVAVEVHQRDLGVHEPHDGGPLEEGDDLGRPWPCSPRRPGPRRAPGASRSGRPRTPRRKRLRSRKYSWVTASGSKLSAWSTVCSAARPRSPSDCSAKRTDARSAAEPRGSPPGSGDVAGPPVALGDHREEQLLLGAEVVEDPGGGDVDLVGHLGERPVAEAALGEHGDGGVDDRLPPLRSTLRLAGELRPSAAHGHEVGDDALDALRRARSGRSGTPSPRGCRRTRCRWTGASGGCRTAAGRRGPSAPARTRPCRGRRSPRSRSSHRGDGPARARGSALGGSRGSRGGSRSRAWPR